MDLLFVDTETNGIPQDLCASFKNIDNWPTIRQIAWIVYSKGGKCISAHNYSTVDDITSQPTVVSQNVGTTFMGFIKKYKDIEIVPFTDSETGEEYSRLVCKDQFGTITYVHMSSNSPELHQSNDKVAEYIQQNAKNLRVISTEKGSFILCKKAEDACLEAPDYLPKAFLPIHSVLDLFLQSLQRCDVIIGHNIAYDIQVILCELYRYGKDVEKLLSMQQFCTMQQSVKFCGFETSNGDRYPKLQELYSKLLHKPFENAHDAYCDIKATVECYWALFNNKYLIKKDYHFLLSEEEKKYLEIDDQLAEAKLIVGELIKKMPSHQCPKKALECFDKALALATGDTEYLSCIKETCFDCADKIYHSNIANGKAISKDFFMKIGKIKYWEKLEAENTVTITTDNALGYDTRKLKKIEPIKEISFEPITQEMLNRSQLQRELENFREYGTPWPSFWNKAINVFYYVFGGILLIILLFFLIRIICAIF